MSAEEVIFVTEENYDETRKKCSPHNGGGMTIVKITTPCCEESGGEISVKSLSNGGKAKFGPDSVRVGDFVTLRNRMAFLCPSEWLFQSAGFQGGWSEILFDKSLQPELREYFMSSRSVKTVKLTEEQMLMRSLRAADGG